MPASEPRLLLTKARGLVRGPRDVVDLGAQLVVYKRDVALEADRRRPHGGVPDYLIPRIFGGLYHARLKCYIGPPQKLVWFSCNEVQREILNARQDRVMVLGAPGSSKTESVALHAVLNCLTWPACPGIAVVPTDQKKDAFRKKFLGRVAPLGWVKDHQPASRGRAEQIRLINDAVCILLAAKRQSKATGSPIASYDAWWLVEDEQQNIDDESLFEADARGRANPDHFQIVSSATNLNLYYFQRRVRDYETAADKRVIRASGFKNVFVKLSQWDRLRSKASAEDYDRIINCLDVPSSDRVIPRFTLRDNVRPIPRIAIDVTAREAQKAKLGPFPNIIGLDPGRLVSAAGVLRAFADPSAGRPLWFALKEWRVVAKTLDWLLQEILTFFGGDRSKFFILVDPHATHTGSYKETSREADYAVLDRFELNWMPAHYTQIDKKASISMVNGLVENHLGVRRFFIAEGEDHQPVCPHLAESLLFLMYKNGEPENADKTEKDLTHSLDWLRYGLHKFEDDIGLIALTGGQRS